VVAWLVVLLVLAGAGGLTIWARQQDAARRAAEARADAAEARVVEAEASLTAISRVVAAATATAQAEANQPELALKRALDLVFEAYKQPNDGRLRALSAAFSPSALEFEGREAEHLISAGTHLAGSTPYSMQVLGTNAATPDEARIRTREVWVYDEVDDSGRSARCFHEDSEQTYTLRRVSGGWLVDSVQLDSSRRTDC
jgi:hypothetical protein